MKEFQILAIVALSIVTLPAFAYIDPGSGSAIMSVIIGFIVASGLAIKTYWYKLKSLFTSKNSVEKKSSGTTDEEDN